MDNPTLLSQLIQSGAREELQKHKSNQHAVAFLQAVRRERGDLYYRATDQHQPTSDTEYLEIKDICDLHANYMADLVVTFGSLKLSGCEDELNESQAAGELVTREAGSMGKKLLLLQDSIYYELVKGLLAPVFTGSQGGYFQVLLPRLDPRDRISFKDWLCLGQWELERRGQIKNGQDHWNKTFEELREASEKILKD